MIAPTQCVVTALFWDVCMLHQGAQPATDPWHSSSFTDQTLNEHILTDLNVRIAEQPLWS